MRRLLVLAAALGAALLAAPSSGEARAHRSRLTCHSGVTVFHRGSARVFWASRGREGRQHPVWYVCSSRLHHPHSFLSGSRGTYDIVVHPRRFGHRVGFEWRHFAPIRYGQEVDSSLGWVDVTSGAEHHTLFSSSIRNTGVPFGDVMGVAVGNDGAIAGIVKLQHDSEVIGYAPNLAQGLGSPRSLVTVDSGDVMPSSLALAGGAITWTTRSGMSGTVNVDG